MLKITATDEQVKYVNELLKKVNFGKRGNGSKSIEYSNNGSKEEQFVGILGELIVTDFFGIKRKERGEGADHGVDMTVGHQRIDVKTMSRKCDMRDYFVHNLQGEQTGDYYLNNVYLLTSLNMTNYELTICGWVTKEEFFGRAEYFAFNQERKNGTKTFKVRNKGGLYELKNSNLNKFESKYEFIEEMEKINEELTQAI